MSVLRTFLAIPLPEDLQNYLAEFVRPFRGRPDRVNWVPEKNLHLTLHFLGPTDTDKIPEQRAKLAATVAAFAPASLTLTDTGVFPHANNPRVLWVGALADERHLLDLHTAIGVQVSAMGYELAKRKFQQHITLGRVKSLSRNSKLVHDFLSAEVREQRFLCDEIKWLQSILTPAGAVYEELETFKLKAGGS